MRYEKPTVQIRPLPPATDKLWRLRSASGAVVGHSVVALLASYLDSVR